jgi:hypothetical protein
MPVAGERMISSIYIEMQLCYSYNNILPFGRLMQNLLYHTSTVISSSPQQTAMQLIQITVIILPHITICYLLCHLFPSHYMLSSDILFFSFLLPAAIALFITAQQRTAHDANSTYLTVLLFSHILTKRHKTLPHNTKHCTWRLDISKVMHGKGQWTANKDPVYSSNCKILHSSKDSTRNSKLIIKQHKLLRTSVK